MIKITIPYVRIGNIIEFVKILPDKEITIRDASLKSRFSESQVRNIIPSVKSLGLIEYKKAIKLTDKGLKFRSSVISKDEKQAKKIIKEQMKNVEPLEYVAELLEVKNSLTIEEIGGKLASKYNKTWSDPLTFRTHGAACASIVAFAGYGRYEGGTLRKGELVLKPSRVPLPDVRVNKIIKILETIYPLGEVSLKDLAEKIGTNEGHLVAELSVCIELKLINRESRGLYRITDLGSKLISPFEKDRKEIFKQCLQNSGYATIINRLNHLEFDASKLGEVIGYTFRSEWSEQTRKLYGGKFRNWLDYAGLLKKLKGGIYTLDSSQLKETKLLSPKAYEFEEGFMKYYNLGKSVGFILANAENKKLTENEVDELLKICQEDKRFEIVAELIREHRELFRSLKDPRIFLADAKLLEKILRGD